MDETLNRVTDMPIEQAAILWCMRLWLAGKLGTANTSSRIERMAAQLDVADAGHFIEGYMEALNRGALRSIEIGCLRCPLIGRDEQMLLDALGLAQERRTFEALLLLGEVFCPEGARAALHNAEGIGRALAGVGRFLPAPHGGGGDPDVMAWFSTSLP